MHRDSEVVIKSYGVEFSRVFFLQAEDGIRDYRVTGVQTCALPISRRRHTRLSCDWSSDVCSSDRSEEHTSDLQSHDNLVCRLRFEKIYDHNEKVGNLVDRNLCRGGQHKETG